MFTISQVENYHNVDLTKPYVFTSTTDEECSLVCLESDIPENTLKRDDHWRMFRIEAVMDFSLIGILAKLAQLLAECHISIFAISTYNTDYILIKEENFSQAIKALEKAGYTII